MVEPQPLPNLVFWSMLGNQKLEFLVLKHLIGTLGLIFVIVVMMLLWCILPRVLTASVQPLSNEMNTMLTQQQQN